MKDYSYNQLIILDMECGGLTKRQAVLSRCLDRRFIKAGKKFNKGGKPAGRFERSIYRDWVCMMQGYGDDLMG